MSQYNWPRAPPIPPSTPPSRPIDLFLMQPAGLEPLRKTWVTTPSNLPEVVSNQSYFDHDHDDKGFLASISRAAKFGSGGTHSSSDAALGLRSKRQRLLRKPALVIFLAFVVLAVVVGAVLGGVLGTMAKLHSDGDTSAASPASPESDANDTVEDHGSATPHDLSQLVTAAAGDASSGFNVILFQDASGELAAIESRGSAREVYLLSSRFGDAEPPMPLEGSPMSFINFGHDGDLHLFYIDDAMRFVHIVRRSKLSGEESWEIGALSADENRDEVDVVAKETLRLTATILPGAWSAMTEDVLVVMCQTDMDDDSVHVFSTGDADRFDSWNSEPFALGTETLGMQFHPHSSGLLILPIDRSTDTESIAGLRIIWDLDDSSHRTTFGIFDCSILPDGTLDDCIDVEDKWEDTGAQDHVLDAVRPLRFWPMAIGEAEIEDPSSTRIRVMDSDGEFLELLWEDDQWTDHGVFTTDEKGMPEDLPTTFTSACSTEDNILYGLADGKMLEFARINAWWEDGYTGPGWEFVGIVDLALA